MLSKPTCFQLTVMKKEINASLAFLALQRAVVQNKTSCCQDACFALCMSNIVWHGIYFIALDQHEEISIQPQAAIEGDDITLTCQAARYLYTGLQWLDFWNRTIPSKASTLLLGNHSISLSLRLHNVTQNSTTGYKCQAYKLHRRAELKNAALIVDGKLEEDMKIWFCSSCACYLLQHIFQNDMVIACTEIRISYLQKLNYTTVGLQHTGTQKSILQHFISHKM